MLKQNLYGLGGFKLVESSEQGMLAEVERAFATARRSYFWLGSASDEHALDLKYLAGGDSVFGPNYGGASVYTNTRAGYTLQCPNVGRLLKNLHFTPRARARSWRRYSTSINPRKQPPPHGWRPIPRSSVHGSMACTPSMAVRRSKR